MVFSRFRDIANDEQVAAVIKGKRVTGIFPIGGSVHCFADHQV